MSDQNITINVQARGVKTTTKQMNGLGASMKRAGRAARDTAIGMAIVGGAVAGTGRKLVEAADAYTNLTNQTKVFSTSSGQAAFKMQDTINIARKMNSSLTEVGTVYQRISMVQAGAGFDDETASKMVENLTKAVKLSGATAQEAEGALRQFSQGLAANRLSGQELNSVLEQTPMIAQLLAEKLGVATGALRQMGKDGLLTTKVLVDTFGGSIDSLEKKFSKFNFTLESQMVSVKREMTLASGKLMHMAKVSDGLGKSISELVTGPLTRMNEVLEKGGPEAEKLVMIFKVGLGVAVGVAVAALGGFVVAIVAMIGPIGVAVTAIAGLAGAMIGYQQAALGNLDSLDKMIARQQALTDASHKGTGAYEMNKKQLDSLKAKRKEHVAGMKEEAKAAEQTRKNNANTMAAFLEGTLSMSQAQDALRYGADSSTVSELNKQKVLKGTAALAAEAAGAQVEAQQGLIKEYDTSGNALRKYRQDMETLGSLIDELDEDTFVAMAEAIQAAFDATDPLVQAQKELIEQQKELDEETASAQASLLSKHDATGQALRDYNADMATLISMQGDIDTDTFDRMRASIENAKDEASGLNDEFDKIVANLNAAQAKSTRDLAGGLSMANQVQADSGNSVPQLEADYGSDVATLQAGIASPDASLDEIEAMKEALELRQQHHEMNMLEAEHKTHMSELNQGLMDQTLTMGELTSGVTASMAQGFMDVAKQTFNVSGQIANMTSMAIGGLAKGIAELATSGKADFKALGLAFVKMIVQMIAQMMIMMALIAAINAMGGGPLLQMMGMGAAGGSTEGKASGGPVSGGTPILVGERGPELFVPPQSGSIKNNTTTQGMMQQEAPKVTVVNVDSSQNTLDALGSEEGENLIMNVIQRNPEVLRSL